MRFEIWKPFYREITKDFNFSEKKDQESAKLLAGLIEEGVDSGRLEDIERTLISAGERLSRKKAYVFGGGPNLEKELDMIEKIGLFDLTPETIYNKAADFTRTIPTPKWKRDIVKITADGTTQKLMDRGIIPDFIVTDLDGDICSQIEAVEKGAIMAVHAHGDNMAVLKDWVPHIKGSIIPTCQCDPVSIVRNFGGFTDGDRAVFFSQEMGVKGVILVGFNMNTVGNKPDVSSKEIRLKAKKLDWAFSLLGFARNSMPVDFFCGWPL